ncbi:MAG: D-inositol-3-phosphate glycosyltransferase [bacterium]|nr:D-inositol-3-phosphate glycosyltransferase [bacterium]
MITPLVAADRQKPFAEIGAHVTIELPPPHPRLRHEFSRRLRVLQVVDGFRMGGAENKLVELIAHLDKKNFEVMLANVGPLGALAEKFNQLGVETFHFPRRFAFDPVPVWRLAKLMRQRQIDVVQTTLLWADIVGPVAATLAKVPVVLSWETVSHEGNPFHNNLQRRIGYQWAMKWVDVIVPVSDEIRRSLIRRRHIPEDKIRVIHYGVDLQKFRSNGEAAVSAKRAEIGVAADTILLGVVARLEPPKGHRYLLEALPEVVKKYPQVHVILIGDGALRRELEAQAQQLAISAHVTFLGARHDVNDLLNAIDLFVLPSISEGLPNVLLEAMACRKPVIASDVGGIPEVVQHGENGYLVAPGDAAALRETLLRSLAERTHWQRFAQRARHTVETSFSLEYQMARFESTYAEFYARKSGSAGSQR